MPSPLTYSKAPWLVTLGIPALALLVVLLLTLGVARARHREPALPRPGAVAAVLGIWAAVCLGLAELGVFARFDGRPPPPFALLLVSTIAATVSFGRSRFGERLARGLPLWLLVAAQSFRLPLELVMHRAASAGTMPVEMSFSGYNFDILSGSTALLLAIGLAIQQGFAAGILTIRHLANCPIQHVRVSIVKCVGFRKGDCLTGNDERACIVRGSASCMAGSYE